MKYESLQSMSHNDLFDGFDQMIEISYTNKNRRNNEEDGIVIRVKGDPCVKRRLLPDLIRVSLNHMSTKSNMVLSSTQSLAKLHTPSLSSSRNAFLSIKPSCKNSTITSINSRKVTNNKSVYRITNTTLSVSNQIRQQQDRSHPSIAAKIPDQHPAAISHNIFKLNRNPYNPLQNSKVNRYRI